MSKCKCIAIVLMCLSYGGAASGREVINIDFNNYGDEAAYTGKAAFDDSVHQWHAFYGGWGVAVGSPRSNNLIDRGQSPGPSTYAEQIWIGDAGTGHGYLAGSELLDDGFVKTGAGGDPNVTLIGGEGAYGGVFDIYVYGDSPGSFTLIQNNGATQTTKSVTGTTTGFVEGENFVVFPAVSITDPNHVLITYSNVINGLQLVSIKEPVVVTDGTVIDARNYDVAFDTNARSGEITLWGPDIGNYVHYLDLNEYMEYDLVITAENQGQYEIVMGVTTQWSEMSVELYLDNILLGTVTSAQRTNDNKVYETDNAVVANLFEGTHILKWITPTNVYGDIAHMRFTYLGKITMNTCADVYTYGKNYPGDITGDCRVDLEDLALMARDWAANYDPQQQ